MNVSFRSTSTLSFALALSLLVNASCTKPESRPSVTSKFGAQSADAKTASAPASTVAPEKSAAPTEIQLVNTKFSGQEDKLEAQVILGGVTSSRVKLAAGSGVATISVPGLPVNAKDTMIVELYEGANIRFVAFRPNTLVEQGQASPLKLEDCALNIAPWDGESNQGACGWSVEESK